MTATAPHQFEMEVQRRIKVDRPARRRRGVLRSVLQVNIRPGEYVANTPRQCVLIVLGNVGKLHVRVDLDENDIARFRPNLVGTARSSAATRRAEFAAQICACRPVCDSRRNRLTGANTERVDTRVLQVIYAIDTKGNATLCRPADGRVPERGGEVVVKSSGRQKSSGQYHDLKTSDDLRT